MNRFLTVLGVVMVLIGAVPWTGADEGDSAENNLKVFYDRGFRFNSRDGKFALRMNGLLQVRHTYVDYDPEIRYNQEDYSNFYVRRARLFFTGHAGSPRFTYLFQAQLEPTQGLNANDLWVEYEFSDLVRLGAGRNKISYGLEFMNSGSALGMIDRSVLSGETDIDLGDPTTPGPRYPGGGTYRFGLNWLADTGFATGGLDLYRSQGIQLRGQRGTSSSPTIEYQVGLWQGRGTNSLSNGGNRHLVAVRVGYHPWGFVDWKVVGDVVGSEHFKLGILGSIYTNRSDDPENYNEGGANLALMARWRGWSVDFEWGNEAYDFEAYSHDFEREGWRLSLGWFIVSAKWELRARYAEIQRLKRPTYRNAMDSGLGVAEVRHGDDWTPALEAKISEITVGASVRILGWRNKLVVDVSRLTREFAADPDAVINGEAAPIAEAPNQIDYRIRTMVQLVF
jgi:hypothetical protein